MKCQVVITLEGRQPFRRSFFAPDYRESLARGRDKARALTEAATGPFTYQLRYVSGGMDWQIMETGTDADLRPAGSLRSA